MYSQLIIIFPSAITRTLSQLQKGTPNNSSKSIIQYWQARPSPTQNCWPREIIQRPSFCFGRTSRKPLPLTHLTHITTTSPWQTPDSLSPSASCSIPDRRRTWTRIDSRASSQDLPPPAPWTPSSSGSRTATTSHTLEARHQTHLLAPLRSIAVVPIRLSCAPRKTV